MKPSPCRGIEELFRRYRYRAVTVLLTGEVQVLYQRFLERQKDPGRHRGHVVNTCYPERPGGKGAGTAAEPGAVLWRNQSPGGWRIFLWGTVSWWTPPDFFSSGLCRDCRKLRKNVALSHIVPERAEEIVCGRPALRAAGLWNWSAEYDVVFLQKSNMNYVK